MTTRLITLFILLIAFGARLYTLGDPAFWYDEGLVGWSARLSFVETARWTAADVHPPLYFWAVTVWRLLVGESEFALRFISLAFGVLSVVAAYKIGAHIQGPAVGNLAALFLALSRFHIWWSQELRMYILGSMFMLFSIWLTLRIAHGRPRRATWLAYILVATAGLYSIYLVAFALLFASFYVTGLWLWHTCARPSTARTDTQRMTHRKYLRWVGAQFAILALFLPWFLLFISSYRTWSDSTPFDFALFVQFYTTMLAVGAASNIDQWLWPVVAIWAILLLGALAAWRGAGTGTARRGGWLIVLLLVLPPLTVYLGTSPRSFFYTPRVEARYLMPFIWSFYVVLGWCVWRLARLQPIAGTLAALVVLVVSGAANAQYYDSRIPLDVYQSLSATLRAHRLPQDGVLLHDDRTWPIFEFYFATPNRIWKGVPNGSKLRAQDADFLLADYWQQHDAVWMVWNEDALRIDENHVLEQWLSERAVQRTEFQFGTKRLLFFARTAARAAQARALAPSAQPAYRTQQRVAEGVTLVGYDQALRRYRVGDEIVLGLRWQSERDAALEVALQDASGATRAQQNVRVARGDSRTLVRFPVLVDLAAGDYQIVVRAAQQTSAIARATISAASAGGAEPDVSVQTARDVRFAQGIRLLGYDANITTLHAGDNVALTLYWQSDQPIAQRYKTFVHVLGSTYNARSKNFLWGQQDQEPLNGALPTTSWAANRTVADPYLFRLAKDAPSGRYTVEIGWYHPTSGERLAVLDAAGQPAGDHVILFTFEVE